MNNETDTSREFRIETLTDEQFAGHVATLQSSLASLNPNMDDYVAIKKYLLFAAEWRPRRGTISGTQPRLRSQWPHKKENVRLAIRLPGL